MSRPGVVVGLGSLMTVLGLGFLGELWARGWIENPVKANFVTVGAAAILVPAVVGVALWRRTGDPLAPRITLACGALALGAWRFSVHPWLASAGLVSAILAPIAAAAIVERHGEPAGSTGRLAARGLGPVLVAAIVAVTAGASRLPGWTAATLDREPDRLQRAPVTLLHAPAMSAGAYAFAWFALAATAAVVGVARWRRWRTEPAAARRDHHPVVTATILWASSVVLASVGVFVRSMGSASATHLGDFLVVVVPNIGFCGLVTTIEWTALVRPRLLRGAGGALVLPPTDELATAVTAEVRAVLGDASARVVFAAGTGWVDGAGRPAELSRSGSAVTQISAGGRTVAAIVHAPTDRPAALGLAVRLLGVTMEREQAVAAARAGAERARELAAARLAAGDAAARRLSAELNQGPIRRLTALGSDLDADPSSLRRAADVLTEVAAEVRALSHRHLAFDT